MTFTAGKIAAAAALAGLAYALAALAAPYISAPGLRDPLRLNLEKTLGRPVELREARYRLFPRPGLSAEEVVIGEDPRFGLEPMAYVGTLQADFALSTLWRGRMEISAVRLVDSSVNVARAAPSGWNLAELLDRTAPGVPSLQLRAGRINFRDGTLKSPFYLNNVDLDLTAGPDGYEWSYEASPARTDRAEAGFGRFIGKGAWRPASAGGSVEIEIELQRSATSEVLTLLAGRDLGIPGRVSSRARLSGPVSRIGIAGSIQFEGLERSTFLGLRGPALRVPYSGELDLAAQKLRLSSPDTGAEAPPVSFLIEVTELLTKTRWTTALHFEKLPADNALDLARRLGAAVPPELAVTGQLDGSLRLAQDQPPAGKVELRDADVSLGAGSPLHLDAASLDWTGASVNLQPALVRWGASAEAQVQGAWSVAGESLDFRVQGDNLPIADLTAAARRIPRVTVPPLLDRLEGGALSGALEFHADAWKGAFQLAGVTVRADGLPPGLVIERAQVALKGDEFSLRRARLSYDRTLWDGEISWRPTALRPLHFQLAAARATGASLESWLRAAAARGTFLERTLRRRPALPPWLRARRAEGTLQIAALTAGDQTLEQVQARLFWDAAAIDIPSLDATWNEARFSGRLAIRLDAPAPAYRLRGRLDNLLWKTTHADLEFDASTSGYGLDLFRPLRAEGTLNAHNIPLGDETARSAMACLDFAPDRLRLTCLELQLGPDLLTGHGASTPDGKFTADLTSPRRTLRLTGTLSPLTLTPEP